MDKIHWNDFNGKYACNWAVKPNPNKLSLHQTIVTCVNCLNLIIKGWEEQISYMKGHPLINAKEGLKGAKKQLRYVKEQLNEGVKND